MRPALLDTLFAPVTALPGIGAALGKGLERLAGPLIVDLLWHLPTGIIDRRHQPKVAGLEPDRIATLRLQIGPHEAGFGRRPHRIIGSDETGFVTLVYFNARPEALARLLPQGSQRIVSGRAEFFNGLPQIVHPDYVLPVEDEAALKPIEPVYPMTAGLMPRILHRSIGAALARAPELLEWIEPSLRAARGWPGWREAVAAAHEPAGEADLDPLAPARERLAYDELLASQLAVALVRARRRRRPGRATKGTGALREKVEAGLGFALTGAQRMAAAEIAADMAQPQRMMRLLQGDVGSGKTVVALLAMIAAVEEGAQAALMAPTELLARQHHATLRQLASPAGIEVGILTGRDKGRARAATIASLASGLTPIVVGTHALFQPEVGFRDLALIVIDEQHRFGVEQRLALTEKGSSPDTLLMSATPIPRSLMMTAYGDLDVSRLTEKPAGRQRIDTRAVPLDRLDEVVSGVGRALAAGAKVYWICPMVEESENADLAAAEARHAALSALFPGRVGLVHGRMKGAEKDAAMAGFAAGSAAPAPAGRPGKSGSAPATASSPRPPGPALGGEPPASGIDLLVATTVVEVGVDVPAATVMVIEHAERFGLAQLHQLRGRIGRGDRQSTCLLLYAPPLGEVARRRLEILRETEDGFRIAEEDLRLRGAGEVLGTRQSGLPQLRLADLAVHEPLVAIAHDDARLALDRDPRLETPRGQALRTLLYLFRRDEAIQYLRAG